MSKKIIILTSWLCVIVTMVMIFIFSAEDGEKSAETSNKVIENVLGIVMDKEEITPQVVQKYQFPFRKAAHFGIYMLLGFCLSNAYRVTLPKMKYFPYAISLPSATLYAISDEFHQKFSTGRAPAALDVVIDSLGAFFGILIFLFVFIFFNYIILKRKTLNKIAPE